MMLLFFQIIINEEGMQCNANVYLTLSFDHNEDKRLWLCGSKNRIGKTNIVYNWEYQTK